MIKFEYTSLVMLAIMLPSISASANQIGISNFDTNAQTTTFDGLGLMIYENQAPLEIDGHTITTDDGIFRYNDFGNAVALCVDNECIGTNTDLGYIDSVFSGSHRKAGAWAANSFNGIIEALFYDLEDVLVGSILVSTSSNDEPLFYGWEHADGIGRIRFNDLADNGSVMTFDNLIVSVPVPSAVWLFGSALGLLGWTSRKVT